MHKRLSWVFPLALAVILPAQTVQFASPAKYGTAKGANGVAAADFDGDGKIDLAVVNSSSYTSPGTLSILMGKGHAKFHAPVNYTMGIEPIAVAAGDFNGDGKPDLAVANYMSSTISILLGNGDGTFQAPVNYSLSGALPNSLAVSDLNGDGNLDLVVANYYGAAGPGSLSVLLGNGDGTFQPPVSYDTGGNAFSVAIADFNGDGYLDLAATDNNFVAGQIWVLLGNGDGTFQSPVATSVPAGPTATATGDFNGDGKADLAIGLYSGMAILFGHGDGTFQAPESYGSENVYAIVVSDFNGDSIQDVAVSYEHGPGLVTIYEGKGDGSFRKPRDFPSGSTDQHSLVATSIRSTSKIDLVAANTKGRSVSVLLNRTE